MFSSIRDYFKWFKYSIYGLPENEINKIILSIKKDDYQYFELIINKIKIHKININAPADDHIGETFLHRAAMFKRIEFCKLLLNSGADINALNKYGDTPLVRAVMSMDFDLCKYFIELGADVNSSNFNGYSPLMYAGSNRGIEMNKIFFLLVNSGANIYHKNSDNLSVTGWAVAKKNIEVTKYLIPLMIEY